MKKNKMMRIASVLLVAVLLSTCAISGTFAKYTTQDSANDVARVAKWGVSLQVIGSLYGKAYKNGIVANNDSSITVIASDATTASDDVVAPGTKNENGFKFSLTGSPEVSSQTKVTIKAQNVFLKDGKYGLMVKVPDNTVTSVNFEDLGDLYTKDSSGNYTKANTFEESATYFTLEDDVVVSSYYYPVVYKLAGSTTYSNGDTSNDTLNKIAKTIAEKFNSNASGTTDDECITQYEVTSDTVAPNTDLATQFGINDENLSWEWAFGTENNNNDGADTILGLLMAGNEVVKLDSRNSTYKKPTEYTDYCLKTSFDLTITVSQVD